MPGYSAGFHLRSTRKAKGRRWKADVFRPSRHTLIKPLRTCTASIIFGSIRDESSLRKKPRGFDKSIRTEDPALPDPRPQKDSHNQVIRGVETVEKPVSERLMKDVHPALLSGTKSRGMRRARFQARGPRLEVRGKKDTNLISASRTSLLLPPQNTPEHT